MNHKFLLIILVLSNNMLFCGASLAIIKQHKSIKREAIVIKKFIYLNEITSKLQHGIYFDDLKRLFINVFACEPQEKDKSRCDYNKQTEILIPYKCFINPRTGEFLAEGDKITLIENNGNIREFEIVGNKLNKDLKYTKKILHNCVANYFQAIKKFRSFPFNLESVRPL